MKLSILAGATSQSVNIFIRDSSSTTGAGLAGLVFNTSSLIAYYTFAGANATATAITLATLAAVNSAYSSGGFKEIDATNMKGLYRLDIPNAALATSKGRSVVIMLSGATNMAPLPLEIELTGWDNQDAVHGGLSALPNTAVTTNASLLTSGTGTDQVSVSAGKILLQATQSGVTIPTVTTVTNQLTGAAVATAIWQDTTAGDFTTASSIGKSLYTSGVVPGGSGGILISGSNAGTTTLAALTVTGATTHTGGMIINAGATITGSANGVGLTIAGGGTSGAGLVVNSTSGDAVQLTPTAGHGINIAANGTSKHGIFATGGTAGTSDGIKAAAGSGGVDIRGNITGNLVGTVSTLTTYTGNTPQTGDAFARLGAPAGASTAADIAAAKVDTAAIKTKTDFLPSATAGASGGVFIAGTNAATTITTGLTTTFTGNLTGSVASVTGAVGSVTGAVGSVTGNVGGNVVGSVASVTARVTANVDQIAGTATGATALDRSTRGIVIATVGAASTTTSIVTSSMLPAAAVIDQFKGRIVTFDKDTTTTNLRGQSTDITGNTALGVLTVTALTDAPVSGDTFVVT